MTTRRVSLIISYCLLTLLSGVSGCHTDDPITALTTVPVNSLSMQINGRTWTPYQNLTDPCYSTFTMQASAINQVPFYTVYAYRDSLGRADFRSQDVLRIQIMNVTKPGVYPLTGTWKADFESNATFRVTQPNGASKRYVNAPGRALFVVTVRELITNTSTFIPSLSGSFAGTLYAEDNRNDSLVIDRGTFAFLKATSNFDQCQQ